MAHRYPFFVDPCLDAFRGLTERFGFAEPVCEAIGREEYVRYERGDQTVSIAYEPGNPPIVELFYPSSETGEAPLRWAETDGVQRSRRIPHLRVDIPFDVSEPATVSQYLIASAEALGRVEHDWLRANSP